MKNQLPAPVREFDEPGDEAESLWQSPELASFGVVDIENVQALLKAVYLLAGQAAREGRVKDVAKLMRIIRDYADLEIRARRASIPTHHQHLHAHVHAHQTTAADPDRNRLAEITDRLGVRELAERLRDLRPQGRVGDP